MVSPDGNGRTGRIILFRECLRHDISPFIIEDANRLEYLEALNRHNYQGCLGQELTEFDYYENPGEIDRKNMAAFEPFIR